MEFNNNLNGVLSSLSSSKTALLNSIGVLCTTEAQLRAPVLTGNLRRCTTFDVPNENEVDIGTTAEAPYAIYVHEGSSKNHNPQPYILDAVMDNIDKIQTIGNNLYKDKMGGD